MKKVGRPAVLMCFMPACFEILGYVVFAPLLLGVSYIESALLGAVLSAVSPAVVVPRMIKLIEEKYGTKKSIPQMILAGASCDDIFVIVLFSAFVSANQGNSINIVTFANIPISIMLGIFLGIIFGFVIYFVFEIAFRKNYKIRGSVKIIILLAVSFLLVSIEEKLKNHIAVSGLLAVTAMACVIKLKFDKKVSGRLSEKFGKLWICAEILLFVLVGASVDIRYTFDAGIAAVGMIFIALVFRAVGVWGCLLGTNLSIKERFSA